MKIFGIVWAASILNPTSSIPVEWVEYKPLPYYTASFQSIAPWLTTLEFVAQREEADLNPDMTFSQLAKTFPEQVPTLSPVQMVLPSTPGDKPSFIPFHPFVDQGLASLQVLLPEADSGDAVAPNQWHYWQSVAMVWLEPATSPVTTVVWDHRCMPDLVISTTAIPISHTAPRLQLWVRDVLIGDVAGPTAAQEVAKQFRTLLQQEPFQPEELKPLFGEDYVGIRYRDELLLVVDDHLRSHPKVSDAAIALQWVNNLRLAFDGAPLEPVAVQMAAAGLTETGKSLRGTASWYGPGFHGRKTANGERYDQNSLTAAHKTLPFNTYLKVTNRVNGQSVVVRINDRGPYIGKRSLDLSRAAAQCLGSTHRGVVPYEAMILQPTPPSSLESLTTVSYKP